VQVAWKRTTVEGDTALYAVCGPPDGVPVVLVHGWALGQHSFRPAMQRLGDEGCRAYAPALPGFGGTAALERRRFSLAGYAAWLDGFCTAVSVDAPVVAVGHSFGGGVATRFAHDHPDRVRHLVLVNAVGGSVGPVERPIWSWGLGFPADLVPFKALHRVVPAILEDAVPNLLRNPTAAWRVADLARRIDLTAELRELRRRGVPATVVWGSRDRIVTKAMTEALCDALGVEGRIVDGNHSWLIANPDAFGDVVAEAAGVAPTPPVAEVRRPARRPAAG
jgi:pimeloyl-ACP methyl ester carboxylesterase